MSFLTGAGQRFFDFATKLAEIMWLNLLSLLCCLPIVTIGAAFSALHHELVRIYRDEEQHITAGFFRAFRDNFAQATKVWLIYLLIYGVLAADYFALNVLDNPSIGYLKLLVPVLVFITTLSVVWAFVLQSRYALSVKDTLMFAFTRVIAFPIRTLFMAASLLIVPALVIYLPQFSIVAVLLGISAPALLRTCFYNHALKVMEAPREEAESETAEPT